MRKLLISLLTCGIFFVAKAQEEEIINYTTEFKAGSIFNPSRGFNSPEACPN
jgi:hypothetical protein